VERGIARDEMMRWVSVWLYVCVVIRLCGYMSVWLYVCVFYENDSDR
jgi:hypothetical protein